MAKLTPRIEIDAEVKLTDLNLAFYQQLEKFAPFGMGNSQFVFASREVKVSNLKRVGANNQHLKLKVNGFEAIAFGMGELLPELSMAKPVDVAFNLTLNEWNKQKGLQLRLKDIRLNK